MAFGQVVSEVCGWGAQIDGWLVLSSMAMTKGGVDDGENEEEEELKERRAPARKWWGNEDKLFGDSLAFTKLEWRF